MRKMLKGTVCLLIVFVLAAGAALADGRNQVFHGIGNHISYAKPYGSEEGWLKSDSYGYVSLAGYKGDYSGYAEVDGMGGLTAADSYALTVISKNASVWSEPKTNSKRLASAAHGETLVCRNAESADDMWMENGFYAVEYKGKDGWVNKDYVVRNTLEIVLMESNVPAYIAPDTSSKKVGSLAKFTRYRVIGIYDDFYIVNFRGAASAFIPMSVQHYDTTFEVLYRQAMTQSCVTNRKTALRTGPGSKYTKVKDVSANYRFEAIDCIDGWYLLRYEDSSTDGEVFVYLNADDAKEQQVFHGVDANG